MKKLQDILVLILTLMEISNVNSASDICELRSYGARIPYLEGNCSTFAVCAFEKIAYISECPKGLHFNRRSSECDLPSRAGCEKFDECIPNYCELCDCEPYCNQPTTEPPSSTPTSQTEPTQPTSSSSPSTGPSISTSPSSSPSSVTPTSPISPAPSTEPSFSTTQSSASTEPSISTMSSSSSSTSTSSTSPTEPSTRTSPSSQPTETSTTDFTSTTFTTPNPKCPDDDSGVCKSQEDGTVLPIVGVCRKFIVCDGECPTEQECEDDLYYNPKTKTCDLPGICIGKENSTKLPVNDDCKIYIECENECPKRMECGDGLYFNPDTGECDLTEDPCQQKTTVPPPPETGPSGINCTSNVCLGKKDGYMMPDPDSVCYYIECFCECDLHRPCAPGTEYVDKHKMCSKHSKVC